MMGAVLSLANLHGADLRDARDLEQKQIDSAHGDESTKLPPGIVMPLPGHRMNLGARFREGTANRRFALTRCWSRGDSKRRSSLRFQPSSAQSSQCLVAGRWSPLRTRLLSQFPDQRENTGNFDDSSLLRAYSTAKMS
jgi:hypothetical protein